MFQDLLLLLFKRVTFYWVDFELFFFCNMREIFEKINGKWVFWKNYGFKFFWHQNRHILSFLFSSELLEQVTILLDTLKEEGCGDLSREGLCQVHSWLNTFLVDWSPGRHFCKVLEGLMRVSFLLSFIHSFIFILMISYVHNVLVKREHCQPAKQGLWLEI